MGVTRGSDVQEFQSRANVKKAQRVLVEVHNAQKICSIETQTWIASILFTALPTIDTPSWLLWAMGNSYSATVNAMPINSRKAWIIDCQPGKLPERFSGTDVDGDFACTYASLILGVGTDPSACPVGLDLESMDYLPSRLLLNFRQIY